ncbi:MAG: TIGR02757 family protein [Bacteroidales bacterium]|nr:TIGR02757 family protein [Bacteroidales bacterium]
MKPEVRQQLIDWAETYNDPVYFQEDPIAFPREFLQRGAALQDIEIAAIFAAHLAWGRRAMIVRDCTRLFDEMEWRPYNYIMAHSYRDDNTSLHRTIKWSEIAHICNRLYHFYSARATSTPRTVSLALDPTVHSVHGSPSYGAEGSTGSGGTGRPVRSLELLSAEEIRVTIFRQKEDKRAANKKINMMRRWMVRNDGKVDLGLWTHTSAADLIIPLDVHVYTQAAALGLTDRKQKDIVTARQITDAFREIWPDDPVKGDFALFGYGVTRKDA